MKLNSAMHNLRSSLSRGYSLCLYWLLPGEVSIQNSGLNLYRDIAWYGVLSGVSLTFTGVFALRLGASNVMVGLLTSLPALINVLFQIPAARLIERQRDRRRILLVSGLLMRLPALLIALAPLVRSAQAEAVVYITTLGTIPAALSNVTFTAMLADVVAPRDRARVVSVRNALLSAVTMITVLAAGRALDILPFPINYQLIFALAFLTSLLSLYYLGRVVMPPVPSALGDADSAESEHPSPPKDVRHWLGTILAQREYMRFAIGSFIFHWALYLPLPLYTIYRVRELHITEGWIGSLAMLESAVTIGAYYVWGKVAARRGSRFVLIVGLFGLCLYPLGTGLCRSVEPLLLVVLTAGIFNPPWTLGLFNGLLEVAPAERRTTYVAVFNTLMNVPAFVAPLVGTTLAGVLGTRNALFIGAALRFLGFLAFWRLIAPFPAWRRGGGEAK